MRMNTYKKIYMLAALLAAMSCEPQAEIEFNVDQSVIEIEAVGGDRTFKVSSSGSWVAMTESPWITISPANGRGTQVCTVKIDSTVLFDQRKGTVRIQSLDDETEKNDFEVIQEGFDYQISLDDTQKDIEEYAGFGERWFEVKVKSNVDFDVVLPDGAGSWLTYKKGKLELDRGSRPREVTVRFDWKINSRDIRRSADIVFQPKEDVQMGKHDALKVVQKAALPIPVGTAAGDSLSLIAVSRALGIFHEWDTTEKMEHWTNVKVWKDGPNKGRVKSVRFFMFKTQEAIPYEIQNLTAAEEINIFSNANTFLLSLDTGEYITKLPDLKRLTIGSYGLVTLHPDFVNLKNLEYLDLGSNNFESIPEILTPENFPNLRTLILNANKRHEIYDLSNNQRENLGGFIKDNLSTPEGMESFKRLLKWNRLDTLVLSVNYLQGELPDMKNEGLPVWTFEELKDSLATGLTALPESLQDLPKVLPNTKLLTLNHNRLTGEIPDWLLKHPKLDHWVPFSLVFAQEGKTMDGKNTGFSNEPASLDYYYNIYVNKKYNPNNLVEE